MKMCECIHCIKAIAISIDDSLADSEKLLALRKQLCKHNTKRKIKRGLKSFALSVATLGASWIVGE